jgi:hypothetical protein
MAHIAEPAVVETLKGFTSTHSRLSTPLLCAGSDSATFCCTSASTSAFSEKHCYEDLCHTNQTSVMPAALNTEQSHVRKKLVIDVHLV